MFEKHLGQKRGALSNVSVQILFPRPRSRLNKKDPVWRNTKKNDQDCILLSRLLNCEGQREGEGSAALKRKA
jgi:hypothetical protein